MGKKHFMGSKTIVGVIILLLPTIKALLGLDISSEEATTIFNDIDLIIETGITLIGSITAIYGRIKVTKKITA